MNYITGTAIIATILLGITLIFGWITTGKPQELTAWVGCIVAHLIFIFLFFISWRGI